MSLADHWTSHMDAGEHLVKVKEFRTFKANSGNNGVDFTVIDAQGRACKTEGFYLSTGALWKLAGFVKACGFDKEECRDYEPHIPQHHQRLVGRKLMAIVTMEQGRDGKMYSRVTDWRRAEAEQAPATQQAPSPPAPQHEPPDECYEPPEESYEPPQDDIPF